MPHILVVEDEQHLADGLRFNLEAEGYSVTAVDTGEAALAAVPAAAFDLIVLDVMLPGITGFDVAALLRRHRWNRRQQVGDTFRFAGKVIDFDNLVLHASGRTVPLTMMEANLLRH